MWHRAKEQVESWRVAVAAGDDDTRMNAYANAPDLRPAIKQQLKQEVVMRRYAVRLVPSAIMDFAVPLVIGTLALILLVTAKP
jgi:hypothetical protein